MDLKRLGSRTASLSKNSFSSSSRQKSAALSVRADSENVPEENVSLAVSEPADIRAMTKIVATLGPASFNKIEELVDAGVDVFRLNTAHGTVEERDKQLADIRAVEEKLGRPIGVLCDLAGPKIRLNQLFEDAVDARLDEEFIFKNSEPKSRNELWSNYEPLIGELQVGESVLLVDGTVAMVVTEKGADYVKAKVTGPGLFKSRQGINLPNTALSTPSLTERDHSNLIWAANNDIDFVSLSFVRTASDITELKALLKQNNAKAMVIAKIEMAQAVTNLEAIVAATDGIMVARGDLGVEIDIAQVPLVQKRLIAMCNRYAKPVIVATQMLDSMQHSRIPTRAEATDVANAVLDGADATMLSGESASGMYPVESVAMMTHIQMLTEPLLEDKHFPPLELGKGLAGVTDITAGIVFGAASIAEKLGSKLIVVATETGHAAFLKAKQRDFIPTVVVSPNPTVLRQCLLFYGLVPIKGAPKNNITALCAFIDRWGMADGTLAKGDTIVIVAGKEERQGAHNVVRVHSVGSS